MTEKIYFADGSSATAEHFHSSSLREEYFRVKHPSGLWIYLFPKPMTTAYALYGVRFGAAHSAYMLDGTEHIMPDGCAHFLEHKMFEQKDGTDAFERFSAFGADANAFTSWDKTAYLFSATEYVPECLETLLDFVSNPFFTDASVQKEQGIIAEEIRMNDDSPSERCFTNLLRAMYCANGIRNEICGTEQSIAEITPEILYKCCELFYRPQNMALVISGNLSLREVISTVDRVLPSAENDRGAVSFCDGNRNETDSVFLPRIEEKMPVGKPLFVIGIKDQSAVRLSPEDRMRRDALMTVLKEMYFSTSSTLYNRLLEEGKISPSFSAGYGASELYAFFEIAGESDDPDEILREVRKTLRNAAETGVDEEDFERARRVLYAKTVKSFDSTRTVAEMLLDFVFSDYELFRYVELFDTISREEVEALLMDAFPEDAFTISVITPSEDRSEEPSDEVAEMSASCDRDETSETNHIAF